MSADLISLYGSLELRLFTLEWIGFILYCSLHASIPWFVLILVLWLGARILYSIHHSRMPIKLGDIAQKVSALACHAKGCRFKQHVLTGAFF